MPFPIAVIRKPTAPAGFEDPADLSDLVAWWDFSDIDNLFQNSTRTTPITTDGQSIKGVTDLSGNGHHLSTAGSGATYETNEINGLSVVKFFVANLDIASPPTIPNNFSYLAVIKPTHTDTGALLDVDAGDNNAPYWWKQSGMQLRQVNQFNSTDDGDNISIGEVAILGSRYASGVVKHYRDGVLSHTYTRGSHTDFAAGPETVSGDGHSLYYGHMGEMIIAGAISDTEWADLLTYMSDKWT